MTAPPKNLRTGANAVAATADGEDVASDRIRGIDGGASCRVAGRSAGTLLRSAP